MEFQNLIKGLKRGEEKAFKELVFSFSSKLLTTARVYCYNSREAEDILQDSFIVIFQKIKTINCSEEKSLLAWMRRIVMNKAFSRNKSFQVKNELFVGEHDIDVHINPEALSSLSYQEIMKLVLSLPTGYRQIFALKEIEGYSHNEIAELLNISVSGSRSQLSRAKKNLQIQINQLSKINQ